MLQAWHWKIISLSCLILCEYPLALWVLPYVDLMGHGHGNGTSLFLMGSTSSNGWVFFPASHVRDFSVENTVTSKNSFPFPLEPRKKNWDPYNIYNGLL